MSANPELFDGKHTITDLKATAEARVEEAHQNAASSARAQRWAVRIAVAALLVSLGAMGLSVVALSESHIHAPAKQ